MTIAIGMISKGGEGQEPGIILAADSETTGAVLKSSDAQKIASIDFKNGSVLLAHANSAKMADSVIEAMQRRANGAEIVDEETVPNLAKSAMREVRSYLVELNKGCEVDWHRYFWTDYPLQLLIAYYFQGKPFLYTLDLDTTIPTQIKSPFGAIGIGEELAQFLLREYNQADPDFIFADIIATTIVEKVIDNVKGCGRPVRLGMVMPTAREDFHSYVFKYPSYLIEWMAKEVKEKERVSRQHRQEEMLSIIGNIWSHSFHANHVKAMVQALRKHLDEMNKSRA